jgi:signal transduction histidine kinase
MDQQADRINRMVEQFVLVEEIRSGKLQIHPDRVDLADIVERSCRQIASVSTGHKVECRVCGEVVVHADRRGLDLVLTNLLENAVKFSSRGSSIEVSLALVNDEAVVCVKDTGVGIPTDRQNHVFDRFYAVKPGLQKGVGLGLYISQQMVASHGGRMWFESVNGQGSSFYFSLPVAEPQRQVLHA